MKAIRTSILLAAGLAAAFAANAQQYGAPPPQFYFGAGIGTGNLNMSAGELTGLNNATVDDKDTTYTVRAGWRFHRYMAVELNYYDLGQYEFAGDVGNAHVTGSARAKSWGGSFVGILPIETVDLYARIGYAQTRLEADAGVQSGGAAANHDYQNETTYGVGARWNVMPQWGVFAEWAKNDKIKVDSYMIGVDFKVSGRGETVDAPGAGRFAAASALFACLALCGCAELLPKAKSEVSSPWHNFEQARDAVQTIVPERTTATELKARGIDPFVSPNVQLLSYSDILLRFPLSASGSRETLDAGLRQCLDSGKACTGYAISVRETKRDRVGNFWLDSLRFERIVEVKGWSFNALILLVGDRVVYTLYGGQPLVHEQEVNKQPLGFLQGWGDYPVAELFR